MWESRVPHHITIREKHWPSHHDEEGAVVVDAVVVFGVVVVVVVVEEFAAALMEVAALSNFAVVFVGVVFCCLAASVLIE